MNLKEWKDKYGNHKLELLAEEVGTTRNYLVQIAFEHRKPSPALARLIEQCTEGEITRFDLRPDVYDREEMQELF